MSKGNIPGMTDRFADKVVVVTGAASGIGAATARLFAAEGAFLVLADLDAESGAALAAELGADRALFLRADVAARADVEAVIAAAVARHRHIDILFNNAGIGCFARTPDLLPESWEKIIAVDLHSIFYACRVAIPHMTRPGSNIVNTASVSGMVGDYGFSAYNAAKGGVINYTRALAVDHARDGIRVNALCPGLIATPLTAEVADIGDLEEQWHSAIPMGRAGTAEEMATAVAFLASDAASYITGAILPADGGMTAWSGQPNIFKIGVPERTLR